MLSLDVADMCCWVLQTLFFNVADVAFRCCRHVVLGVVSKRKGKRLVMLDVARNTGRNFFQQGPRPNFITRGNEITQFLTLNV
jgi:hypothetical protein